MNQQIDNSIDDVGTYKCPNCGNDLVFDPASGKLACSSCGSSYHVSAFEKFENTEFEKIKEKTTTGSYNEDEVKEYTCKNCGAVLITDATTSSTICNFCGSPMVIADRLSGDLAPAKVIPFTITQQQAQDAFKKWCKNGLVTPKGFMNADRIKSIEGIYIPFWLYDIHGNGEGEATCWNVRRYTRGEYIYTETKYYVAYRRVASDYLKIPVDASEKMVDNLMDLLEPFNYNDLTDFHTAHLSGFSSEKYSYDEKELFPRVKTKTDEFIREFIMSTIRGYQHVSPGLFRINAVQRDAVYTMLPVYVVYYNYNNKDYLFAMNGQTGKIVGKPPICKKRVAMYFFAMFFLVFILGELINWIVGGI